MRVSSTNIWECQMSSFSLFDADEAAQAEPARQARIASNRLAAAIDDVRAGYGKFLLGATGLDEFEDRWHYSKKDIRSTVEPHLMPVTGVMRRVHDALRREFRAGLQDAPDQHLQQTFSPSDGTLIPDGNFPGYLDDVDQGGPEKVQRDFGGGEDSGSDKYAVRTANCRGGHKPPYDCENPEQHEHREWMDTHGLSHEEALDMMRDQAEQSGSDWDDSYVLPRGKQARRRQAKSFTLNPDSPDWIGHHSEEDLADNENFWNGPGGQEIGGKQQAEVLRLLKEERDRRGRGHEAARLTLDLYTDWARGNGLRVASLDTLELYSPNVTPDGFQTLYSAICRKLAEVPPQFRDDEEDRDEEDDRGPEEDDDSRDEDDEEGDDREEDDDADSDEDDDEDDADDDSDRDADDSGDDEEDDSDDEDHGTPPWVTEARRRYYAEEQQESGSGDGNQQQGSPPQQQGPDPSQQGMDPSQMMQGPPPGGNGEGAPAPDHLLDVAGQAVAQAIEQQTQQYQQIIAPLSQAIQAIQFAQQVEQAAHPLDVTPPQGTIDVVPQSAAPQPQMMQARRRRQAGVNCPECGKYLRDSIARSGHAHGPNGEVYDADPQYGFESRGEYMSRGKDGLPPYSRQGRRRQAIFQTWPSEEAYQRHLEDERYAEEDRNAPPVAPPRFSDEDVAYLKSLGQTPDQAGGGFPDWESYHRYHDFRQARQQQAARRSAAWPNNNDDDLYDENGDYIGTPWPEDLKHHLLSDGSPHAAYDAGYDASWHPAFRDSGDPWGDAGEAWYNAGGKGPGFDDGWVDAASDIPHRYNDPEGYAAYHAEMDVPRHASQGRRHSPSRQARRRRASDPRDRAGDAWRDGRDRGVAEHGRHDLEDYDDDVLPDGFIPQDDTQANVDVALGKSPGPGRRSSRGRRPFL